MFKNEEQIKGFVNHLEVFIRTVIIYHNNADKDAATALNKVRDTLESHLKAISGLTPASDTTDTLSCPECGHDMALRTNRSNGNKFWGCKKYPECRGTRDENGLSKAEREEAKFKKESQQQDGFSFNRDKRNPVTEVGPLDVETHKGEHTWINPFRK